MLRLAEDGKHSVNILDEYETNMQKLIFGVSQHGNLQISEIMQMDYRQFWGIAAMIRQRAEKENEKNK